MNLRGVFRVLSYVVGAEGVFLLLPAIVGFIYGEIFGAVTYLIVAAVCLLFFVLSVGFGRRHKAESRGFYVKEGFVTTALCWIVMSLIGAVPFVVTGDIPNYVDALFETVSGFTTTGSSILFDVECMLHCNLFFRSFTHWIGGMGILVFVMAIMPMSGSASLSLMKAESPGPSVSKLVPKIQTTALILYVLYIVLTVLEFVLLLFDGDMPVFNAICHTFGTAGTGGFSVTNDSVAGYSDYVKIITTVFMMLFGLNFTFYYLLLMKKFRDAFGMEEIRWYLLIYLFAAVTIIGSLFVNGISLSGNVLGSFFTCASLMTTTGYTIVNYNDWPVYTHIVFMLLMFIGGCAGSTGGGFKVSRIMLLIKQIGKEVRQQIHPNRVYIVRVDKKPVPHEVIKSCNTLLIAYLFIFAVSLLIVAWDGFDLTTTFVGVLATYNNIGAGLGGVGVGGSFGIFSDTSKIVMIFDMLAGRLEIVPMLLLFHPTTWSK